MNTLRNLLLTTAALAVAFPLSLAAQRGPGGPGPFPPGPNPAIRLPGPVLHQLNLTTDQMTQLHALDQAAMQGQLGDAIKAEALARHALELQVWNPTADPATWNAAVQALATASTQLDILEHQNAMAILNLLTEAQRTQLQQWLANPPRPGGRRGPPADGGY